MCFIVIEISFLRPKPLSRDVLDKPAHHRDKTTQRYSPRKEPVPCWSLSLGRSLSLVKSCALEDGSLETRLRISRLGSLGLRRPRPGKSYRSGGDPKPTEPTGTGNERLKPESPAQFQTTDRTGGLGRPKGRNRRVVARTGIEPVFQP